jgi:pimeloyl-ACP methyl ester carboxylesterase
VCNPPSESLGFVLADAGYDVWLGNVRGNEYSLGHTGGLTPKDDAFWTFSMDEMVEHDLPAMLAYALRVSGAATLRYVGHSQGTAIMMMALAGARGKAAAVRGMVSHAALLGPVATIRHARLGLLELLVHDSDIFALFGRRSFALTVPTLERIFPEICAGVVGSHLCEDVIMALVGWDPRNANFSRVPDYVSFDPAGTSVKNMDQWRQWRLSGRWQMYDYGRAGNEARYGSPDPPAFDPAAIAGRGGGGGGDDPRLSFVSGGRDTLADPQDVAELEAAIHARFASRQIADYNHLDFLWAENAKTRVYDDLLAFFLE